MKRFRLGLTSLALALISCQSKPPLTDFEKANQQLVAAVPDVDLTLATRNDSKIFHVGEAVRFDIVVSAKMPGVYRIDQSTGYSGASAKDTLHIAPGGDFIDTFPTFVCCAAGKRFIRREPARYPIGVYPIVFSAPGTYEIYFTTATIFRLPEGKPFQEDYGPSPLITASKILTLQVIPADDEWSRSYLNRIVSRLSQPSPSGSNYEACGDLEFLDTEAAIAEKLKLIVQGAPCGSVGLGSTTRPAYVQSEMKELLRRPDVPVSYVFVSTLATVTVRAAHPELRPQAPVAGAPSSPLTSRPIDEAFKQEYEDAEDTILTALRAAILHKDPGNARAVSLNTLSCYAVARRTKPWTSCRGM